MQQPVCGSSNVLHFYSFLSIIRLLPPDSISKGVVFSGCPVVWFVRLFIRSSGQIWSPRYLTEGVNNYDKTDSREDSRSLTDDLIGFWRSKVKVTAGRRGQILWTPYLMNYLSNLDETCREYLLASTDDLVRFWRSKVKVTAVLHVCWWRHPRRGWGIKVHLLFVIIYWVNYFTVYSQCA